MIFNKKKENKTKVEHPIQTMAMDGITLEGKFNHYLRWYYDNVIKASYPEYLAQQELNRLCNFIDKMAVWYELRYPNYEINRLMPCVKPEDKDVSDILFNSNFYSDTLLPPDSDVRGFDWADFYNPKAFIDSLPREERAYLKRVKYQDLAYLNPNNSVSHFHLTSKGRVSQAEGIDIFLDDEFTDKDLEGMPIKNVLFLLESNGYVVPEESEVKKAINGYEIRKIAKEVLLDMVLFKIMLRGRTFIGPRRGFLFAKEFGRNLDTVMEYGVDVDDPGLDNFIDCYLMHGGNPNLKCYINYFSGYLGYRELTEFITNPDFDKEALYQRLVNALSIGTQEEFNRK